MIRLSKLCRASPLRSSHALSSRHAASTTSSSSTALNPFTRLQINTGVCTQYHHYQYRSFSSSETINLPRAYKDERIREDKAAKITLDPRVTTYASIHHRDLTQRVLQRDLRNEDLHQAAVECIRYWSMTRTEEGFYYCINDLIPLLIDILTQKVQKEIKSDKSDRFSPTQLEWFQGAHFPTMTKLINAVLDQYRIIISHQYLRNGKSSLPHPIEVYNVVEGWHERSQQMLVLNTRTYTSIMHAAVEIQDLLHQKLPRPGYTTPDHLVARNKEYTNQIQRLADLCKSLFFDLMDKCKTVDRNSLEKDYYYLPDAPCITLALRSQSLVSNMESTLSILTAVRTHNKTYYTNPIETNIIVYNAAIRNLTNNGKAPDVSTAERLLRGLLAKFAIEREVCPDLMTFQYVIFGWLQYDLITDKKNAFQYFKNAVSVLELMMEQHSLTQVVPTADVYSKLMVVAFRLGLYDRVIELGNSLTKIHKATQLKSCEPNYHVFRPLLGAYSKSKRFDEALRLYDFMINMSIDTGDEEYMPKWSHSIDLVNALIRNDTKQDRAESIFYKCLNLNSAGRMRISEDNMLEAILYGWEKSNAPEALDRATKLFNTFTTNFPNIQIQQNCYKHIDKLKRKHREKTTRTRVRDVDNQFYKY